MYELRLTPEEQELPRYKEPPYNLCTKLELRKHYLSTHEEPVAVFCNGVFREVLYEMKDAYHDNIEDAYVPKAYPATKENWMKSLKRIRTSIQANLKRIHTKKLYKFEKRMIRLQELEKKVLVKLNEDKIEVFDIDFKSLRIIHAVATLEAYVSVVAS